MGKMVKSKPVEAERYIFKTYESYSPEEIWAAGGTTAFAYKMGKTAQAFRESIKFAPEIEPFTDEEWDDLMEQVKNDK